MKISLTWILTFCLCVLCEQIKAQYVLVPIAPPPMFSFNDLWHFSVQASTQDNTAQFYISMRIFDGNNQLKLKSNTSIIQANALAGYYNSSNINLLQPFTTSYYDGGLLQNVVNTGGQFPPGIYHIVFTLHGKFADGEFTPLYEDASEAIVEAMWPPMLLSPPDGDTIHTSYPLLTWTPAFSSVITGPINYTLNLVEIYSGQNAYQAIQSNPLYFTENNIPVTMLPYPPHAQPLDTSKTYAWQVHANSLGTSLGSSEVWRFTWKNTENTTQDSLESNVLYFDITRQLPQEFYRITDGFLYFKYDEEYFLEANTTLKYDILDHFKVPITQSQTLPVERGLNRYKISQCQLNLGTIKTDSFYYVRITSPKKEIFTIKFYPLIDHNCSTN